MARKGYVKKFIKKEKQSAGEPNVELIKSNSDLARALYWYTRADVSDKKKKAWFLEYAKEAKLDVKAAKRINEKYFNCTLVHSIRLKMNGFNDERSEQYIAKNLPALMARAPKPEKKAAVVEAPKTNKPTIQDRIAAQVSPILAEIDYFADCFVVDKEEKSIKDLIDEKVGLPQTKLIKAHLEAYVAEITGCLKENDMELHNAHPLKQSEMKKMIKWLSAQIEECDKWLNAKKKMRKAPTRAKKVKPAHEIVKNVTVAEETVLKPTKLIGSGYAVIYSEKYNVFTFFVAEDAGGLSVRGKSIVNFDEKKSQVLKPQRKYKNFVKDVSSKKGVNALKNLMRDSEKFKTTKGKPSGRLNEKHNILVAI